MLFKKILTSGNKKKIFLCCFVFTYINYIKFKGNQNILEHDLNHFIF